MEKIKRDFFVYGRAVIVTLLLFVCQFFGFSLYGKNIGPIDLVYTWVDGADIEWQLKKAKYSKMYGKELSKSDANGLMRFRNRDELKYSLRSVFLYAPFVNHIYIVTCGQIPSWLRPHPKITVVSHQEIFPFKDDLPTFNSQAIEANLHRIPNLSENYIYFNDDVFLGCPVTADDFYTPDGKVKLYFGTKQSPTGAIKAGEITYHSAWKNTNARLNETFKEEPRFHMLHTPDASKKSIVRACERWFPDVFNNVSSHKFRLACDYTLTNGLIPYFAIYTGQGIAAEITNKTIWFGANFKRNVSELLELTQKKYKTFCINDSQSTDNELYDTVLKQFLEFYFPEPAPWEKISKYKLEVFPCTCCDYEDIPGVTIDMLTAKKISSKGVVHPFLHHLSHLLESECNEAR